MFNDFAKEVCGSVQFYKYLIVLTPTCLVLVFVQRFSLICFKFPSFYFKFCFKLLLSFALIMYGVEFGFV